MVATETAQEESLFQIQKNYCKIELKGRSVPREVAHTKHSVR